MLPPKRAPTKVLTLALKKPVVHPNEPTLLEVPVRYQYRVQSRVGSVALDDDGGHHFVAASARTAATSLPKVFPYYVRSARPVAFLDVASNT